MLEARQWKVWSVPQEGNLESWDFRTSQPKVDIGAGPRAMTLAV
jgi:hypothetical protein